MPPDSDVVYRQQHLYCPPSHHSKIHFPVRIVGISGFSWLQFVLQRAAGIQQPPGGSEWFTCEFNGDFKDIGMSLDVDEEGRLVVQEVCGILV